MHAHKMNCTLCCAVFTDETRRIKTSFYTSRQYGIHTMHTLTQTHTHDQIESCVYHWSRCHSNAQSHCIWKPRCSTPTYTALKINTSVRWQCYKPHRQPNFYAVCHAAWYRVSVCNILYTVWTVRPHTYTRTAPIRAYRVFHIYTLYSVFRALWTNQNGFCWLKINSKNQLFGVVHAVCMLNLTSVCTIQICLVSCGGSFLFVTVKPKVCNTSQVKWSKNSIAKKGFRKARIYFKSKNFSNWKVFWTREYFS